MSPRPPTTGSRGLVTAGGGGGGRTESDVMFPDVDLAGDVTAATGLPALVCTPDENMLLAFPHAKIRHQHISKLDCTETAKTSAKASQLN